MHGAGRVPQRDFGEKAGKRNTGSSSRLLWKDVGKCTISSPGLSFSVCSQEAGFSSGKGRMFRAQASLSLWCVCL